MSDASSLASVSALKELCQATTSFTPSQVQSGRRIVEIGKHVMIAGCQEFISSDGSHKPMLTSKSADGTPVTATVSFRYKRLQVLGTSFRRSGRECKEFLLKNQYIRWVSSTGEVVTRCLLQDPLPLTHGKTVHAIFTACKKDWKSLREMGHKGIAIEHYAYDRLGFQAHERVWRQWHAMNSPSFDKLADGPAEVFRLTEFLLFTPCAAHDAHNALKWALLHSTVDDGDTLRDAYICIESIRNSMGLICQCTPEWVLLRLTHVEPLSHVELDNLRALWDALGVDPETVQTLTEVLELRFEGGRICVTRECCHMEDLTALVECTLMSVWKFQKWTTSRFLSVGSSSRTVVAGLLTGLEDLVTFIRTEQKGSLYYLNGFGRLNNSLKLFMVRCAVVSRVAESVLLDLMEDPRVCQRYSALWEIMCEEMMWVATLGQVVWEKLAHISGACAHDLKSDCIRASHVSFHFFWRRCLKVAGGLPWSLARGNLEQNLDDLVSGPCPHESVAKQIWLLMQVKFPVQLLCQALQLLREVPWTTMLVEQQHGVVSAIHRHHPDFTHDMLALRAMILQLSKLLPVLTQEEKLLHRLHHSIARALARRPNAVTGRHMLLHDLLELVKNRAPSVAALSPRQANLSIILLLIPILLLYYLCCGLCSHVWL